MPRLHGSIATPRQAFWFGLIFILLGCTFVGIGSFFASQSVYLLFTSQKADGVVVRLEKKGSVYDPVIAYITASGQGAEFTGSHGTNPPSNKVGDQVEVLYMPDHPERASLNSFMDLWLTPLFPLIFGLFWLITGIFMLSNAASQRQQ